MSNNDTAEEAYAEACDPQISPRGIEFDLALIAYKDAVSHHEHYKCIPSREAVEKAEADLRLAHFSYVPDWL